MESNKENKEEEKKLYQRFSEAGLQYSHAVGISSRREKKENNERRVIRPLWIFLSTFTFPFFVRFFPFRFLRKKSFSYPFNSHRVVYTDRYKA